MVKRCVGAAFVGDLRIAGIGGKYVEGISRLSSQMCAGVYWLTKNKMIRRMGNMDRDGDITSDGKNYLSGKHVLDNMSSSSPPMYIR